MPDPYEIATWRFEQIAPLIDPSLSRARRRAALRERVARRGARSTRDGAKDDRTARVSRSTLFRWLKAYRNKGYVGLLPKPRADRDSARRSNTKAWIAYAIWLLYEQPDRSLSQLEVYLGVEFVGYALARTTLRRHLRMHPAFAGIKALRSGKKSRLRDLYEADHPHECWQLDGKGPFPVHLMDGTRVHVHVLSILDDHSRFVLAAVVANAEDVAASIAVFAKAVAKWVGDQAQAGGCTNQSERRQVYR